MHLSVFTVAKKTLAKAPKRHTECCPSRVSANGAGIIGPRSYLCMSSMFFRMHALLGTGTLGELTVSKTPEMSACSTMFDAARAS